MKENTVKLYIETPHTDSASASHLTAGPRGSEGSFQHLFDLARSSRLMRNLCLQGRILKINWALLKVFQSLLWEGGHHTITFVLWDIGTSMQDGLTRVHSSVCSERQRDSFYKAELLLKIISEKVL